MLQATNRLAEAEPLMRRMVLIFLKFLPATGHEHPHTRPVLRNYAVLCQGKGVNGKGSGSMESGKGSGYKS